MSSAYQRGGYIVVRGLISQAEAEELRQFAMDILYGRIELPGVPPPPPHASEEELFGRFSRIHMLHRVHEVAERYMLHPRVLDVLEALIGPDVLALQTMLFLNPPGRGGQGWHQDAYYITTYPDTLIGAWIALDTADEETGCLRMIPGSSWEPTIGEAIPETRPTMSEPWELTSILKTGLNLSEPWDKELVTPRAECYNRPWLTRDLAGGTCGTRQPVACRTRWPL